MSFNISKDTRLNQDNLQKTSRIFQHLRGKPRVNMWKYVDIPANLNDNKLAYNEEEVTHIINHVKHDPTYDAL